MKILFRGIWETPKYKFKCDRCGSVWECEENEAQKFLDRNEMYIVCVCPVCGEKIAKNESRCGNTKVVDK